MPDKLQFFILLAERNPNVRNLMQRELLKEGYSVATAKDGIELCTLLEKDTSPDLVLLDPELPYLGEERILRCVMRRTVTLPLIIWGFSEEGLPADLRPKVEALVEKSEDPEDLKSTVRSVLKTRSLGGV